MIRTLKRRFVITAMAAITALLLLLLGAINAVNTVLVKQQARQRLEMLLKNEGNPDALPMGPGKAPQGSFGQGDAYGSLLSSDFFTVRLDAGGNVIFSDISHIPSLTEEEASALAQEAFESGKSTGKAGHFQYRAREGRSGPGTVIVFLDTSGDLYSCLRVLLLSVGIGAFFWLLMLLLVILLSKKAIAPIAENIEKQKQFVTNAGHELKTPLAIIQSNTEAMELYTGENKWSRNIKAQTARLNELMKNLLTLARMDESTANLNVTEFALSVLLEELTQSFSESLQLRQITLQTQIQPQISFRANREHISQLICVLMDNAAKYTNTGGRITVSLEKTDKRIRMEFSNTCECLPAVPPDKLFDRFFRADEARTQKTGGTGIGLSVAQSITTAYRGRITAEYRSGNEIAFLIQF